MRHRRGEYSAAMLFLAVAFSKSYGESSFQGLNFKTTAKDGDRP